MPERKTKRGTERTPLEGRWDVIVCGASFAGLTVARELAGSGARVLVLDRYEIGERQTSACAAPTEWLDALGLSTSIKQTFDELVFQHAARRHAHAAPVELLDLRYLELCGLLWAQCDAEFETAKVEGRADPASASMAVTAYRGGDRPRHVEAPLVVDALGWRRALDDGYQPPDAPLSRGLEVHPGGSGEDLELWIERGVVPAGYGWSFPADDELRVGVGSFDPRFHVKDPTVPQPPSRLDLPAGGATRATGSPTACARRRRTATCSSAATPPATACR